MKLIGIIQARMSSRRLPGKVLMEVNGKPILGYVIDRVRRVTGLDEIVVATSTSESDEPIENYCQDVGVLCDRGDLVDVAGRFLAVTEKHPCDGFARICADSPFTNWRLIDKGLEIMKKEEVDVVTNKLHKTYPVGMAMEIIRTDIFRSGYKRMHASEHFEHVTRFFYENAHEYRIHELVNETDHGGLQLAVDTAEDFSCFSRVIREMKRPAWSYGCDELVSLYRSVVCRKSD